MFRLKRNPLSSEKFNTQSLLCRTCFYTRLKRWTLLKKLMWKLLSILYETIEILLQLWSMTDELHTLLQPTRNDWNKEFVVLFMRWEAKAYLISRSNPLTFFIRCLLLLYERTVPAPSTSVLHSAIRSWWAFIKEVNNEVILIVNVSHCKCLSESRGGEAGQKF